MNKLYLGNNIILDLSDYATQSYVDTQVSNVDVTDQLTNYVQKESGKGLSSNDYTTAEKEKLASLELYNDSAIRQLITDTSNNLATNYLTSTQITTLFNGIKQFDYVLEDTLPDASAGTMYKIYLIPNSGSGDNTKDEYITVATPGANEGEFTYRFEKFGTTAVDLTNYYTKSEVYNKTEINNTLKNYYTNEQVYSKYESNQQIEIINTAIIEASKHVNKVDTLPAEGSIVKDGFYVEVTNNDAWSSISSLEEGDKFTKFKVAKDYTWDYSSDGLCFNVPGNALKYYVKYGVANGYYICDENGTDIAVFGREDSIKYFKNGVTNRISVDNNADPIVVNIAEIFGKSYLTVKKEYDELEQAKSYFGQVFAGEGDIIGNKTMIVSGHYVNLGLDAAAVATAINSSIAALDLSNTYQPKGSYLVADDISTFITGNDISTFVDATTIAATYQTKNDASNHVQGNGVMNIVKCTSTDYANLETKASDTLYIVMD